MQIFAQATFLKIIRQAAQLLHVLPAVVIRFAFGFDVFLVAGIRHDAVKQRHNGSTVAHGHPLAQHGAEIRHQGGRTADLVPISGCVTVFAEIQQHLPRAQAGLLSRHLQGADGLVANATRRNPDHAQQADLVRRVLHQTQKTDHVFDFLAAVKTLRSDQAVGQTGVHKSFFDHAGLGVGAVHDRKIIRAGLAGADVLLDGIHHEGGLCNVIRGHVLDDLVALAAVGEEVLGSAVAIAVNDLASGIQHRLGGAVVLFQQDLLTFWKILFKTLHVAVIRAAPAINALVFIPHHEDVMVIRG